MKKIKLGFGADHAGFPIKSELVQFLSKEGYQVVDFGTSSDDMCDYPDFAVKVARAVASGLCERGILACGSGLGMAIAANKIKGIRAVTAWSPEIGASAAQHNWANILCVPVRYIKAEKIFAIVKAWLETPFEKGGRHERRVKKIAKIEGVS